MGADLGAGRGFGRVDRGSEEKATRLASLPVRAGSPWQVVQVWVVYSMTPFTWVAALTATPV